MNRPRLVGGALAGLTVGVATALLAAGRPRLSVAVGAVAAFLMALVAAPGGVGATPETDIAGVGYAVPGDDFAAALGEVSAVDRVRQAVDHRERLRERVGEAVVTPDADAGAAVARFRDGPLLPDRDIGDRVRELLTGTTVFERRTRAAIDAAHRRVYGEVPTRETTPAGRLLSGRRAAEAPEPTVDGAAEPGSRRTRRWRPLGALALAAGGLGAATGSGTPLLVAGVCVAFVAYGRLGSRTPPVLSAERRLSPADPAPGETVTVSLVVRNETGKALPAVHVRDPLPPGVEPVDGQSELHTTLRAGGTARLGYEVTAARGEHEFEAPVVTVTDLPGAREWTRRPAAAARVTCVPTLDETAPVETAASDALRPGPTRTPTAGAGIELHSVREYVRGDPLSRVDWKGLARSGDLRTVEFHRERALTVVLVVDARRAAYCAPEPSGPPSVERSVTAARRVAGSLLDGGHRVGVAALSRRDCWCPPGTGPDHRPRLRRLLALAPALSWRPPGEPGHDRLRDRLVDADLVMLLSPLVDDRPAAFAREVGTLGPTVRVVSPDPTAADTPGRRFARLARRARRERLRRSGVEVTDWPRDARIGDVLARLAAGGGR